MVAVLPEGHVLAQSGGRGDAALPLKALACETFIGWGRPPLMGFHPPVIAACHAAGFNPRLALHRRSTSSQWASAFPLSRPPCGESR
jgi:hypothetical protein